MIAILSTGVALAQTFYLDPRREQAALDDHNRQADGFTSVPDPKFQLDEGLTQITMDRVEVGQVLVWKVGDIRHETWVMSQNPANLDGLSFQIVDPGLSYAAWVKPVYPAMYWTKMCENVGVMPPVIAPALALSGQTISRATYDLLFEGVVYGQLLRETQKVSNVVQRYADYWVYYDGYAEEIQAGSTLTVDQVLPGYGATGSFLDDNNAPGVRYSKVKWMWSGVEQLGCPM